MTAEQILAAIQEHHLECCFNWEATEPRWEVTPSTAWKPTFDEDLSTAVAEWVARYATVCTKCGK